MEDFVPHRPDSPERKRKRSSILVNPRDKRISRDSRTVSFNDCYQYKELHQDGTCDVTNLFLCQDMDLTLHDVVDPTAKDMSISSSIADNTVNGSIDMSLDTENNGNTNNTVIPADLTDNDSQVMDMMISQYCEAISMPDCNEIEISKNTDYNASKVFDEENNVSVSMKVEEDNYVSMAMKQDERANVSVSMKIDETTVNVTKFDPNNSKLYEADASKIQHEISSQEDITLTPNESIISRRESTILQESVFDPSNADNTLMANIKSLEEKVEKIDHKSEERRQMLDEELKLLFKFYRHIVNKDDPYEFAIRMFGLRYNLWLVFKINPDLYPNERLRVRFAVHKKDRHLYPFATFSEAIRRVTPAGRPNYIKNLIINAQKFRRFLRAINYGNLR